MRTSLVARSIVGIVTSALIGCEAEAPLLPPEVFHWSDQPVSFRPPPAGWRREGELSGGVRGVRFVKERGRGEAITVGELHRVIGELALEDVVGPLRKQRYASTSERKLTIGGQPAVAFEWTMRHDGRTFHRREAYVMHRNHVFTARFIGLDESIALFDRVVESIEFPA